MDKHFMIIYINKVTYTLLEKILSELNYHFFWP